MRTAALIDKELEHVLAALTPSNALVAQVSLHTGLRVSDVLALRTEQLAPRFYITEQKTGKRKLVGLPGPLLDAIKAQAGTVWAFPGRDPENHRSRQAVWKDVKRAATAFRVPANIGAHSFRKTYAQDVMDACGDVERVRRALNHSSPAVTMLYLVAARNVLNGQGGKRRTARYGKRLR